MFQALLAHSQEALHKQHLVYCGHVMSVGCTRIGVEPAQMALGVLHVCYVSRLHQGWGRTSINGTWFIVYVLCQLAAAGLGWNLHKWHLVYCLCVMSVGCTSSTPILVQPTDVTHKQYIK
jgi:hypothetical protein